MRQFIYFSSSAQTSGKALSQKDLMQAGRIDIAIHFIIHAFFLSNKLRENVKVHLVFYGMPDPPKHIELEIIPETEISKKNIKYLLKKTLYKYKKGEKREVLPGCWIEKKSLGNVIKELSKENKIFVLDEKGEHIKDTKIPQNSVFVVGDHKGFPKKELKRLRKTMKSLSVGKNIYFASQIATIINYELDLRGI